MSKCNTCDYALYDGMCLAQGKFTMLDADSCELYRPTQDYEVTRLKRENAKLRELCADLVRQIKRAKYFDCFGGNCEKWGECMERHGDCVLKSRARELGIEAEDDK